MEYKKELEKEKSKNVYSNLFKIENEKLEKKLEDNNIEHKAKKDELTNIFKTIMNKYQDEKKNDEMENKKEKLEVGSDNEKPQTNEYIYYNCKTCDFKSIWKTKRDEHMKKCNRTKKPRTK